MRRLLLEWQLQWVEKQFHKYEARRIELMSDLYDLDVEEGRFPRFNKNGFPLHMLDSIQIQELPSHQL